MSLAQTSLVLRNGEVEQKHSDESECLKQTKGDERMEFVMNVPRLFDVKINQFEKFLLNNGWKRDQEYFDSLLGEPYRIK